MNKKIYAYEHGHPMSEVLCRDLDAAKEMIASNKPGLLVVDGGLGEGKTTLAVHMADYYQGSPINFREQIAMGAQEFVDKFELCIERGYKVIIYDEAGDYDKRTFYSDLNKLLRRVFDTFRTHKILVIMVLPLFSKLETDMLEKQIVLGLIHCYGRGMSYGRFKTYDWWKMHFLLARMKKLVVPASGYTLEQPVAYGQFLDLPPERSRLLDELSTKGKQDIIGKARIAEEGLKNTRELARACGRSLRWVQAKLKKGGFKPRKVHKGRAYYEKAVVGYLMEARAYGK